MRGLQKSKQVTWASDLYQVKLFVSEDCPSKAGIGTRNNLKRKRSVDCLPPGFKGVHPQTEVLKNKLAEIPHPKWRCPPTFVSSPSWRVAVGEESEEVKTQNQRELRVLEAVYPRPSAIPPNPIVSLDVGYNVVDDLRTPLVPLTPIEDEETGGEAPLDSTASALVPDPLLEKGRLGDYTQPQQLAAIITSLSALATTTSGHEKLIDYELLMKILTNPSTLEQFIKRQGNPPSQNALPLSQPYQIAPTQSVPVNPICNPPIHHFNHLQDTRKPSSTTPTQSVPVNNPICNPPIPCFNQLQDTRKPSPTVPITTSAAQPTTPSNGVLAPPLVKDMNYYKSLIQQHGEEKKQEGLQPQLISYNGSNPNLAQVGNFSQTRESKPKFTKPCSYFNSLKGCRNGAKCTYQHDPTLRKRASSAMELQSAKKMKMEKGMRGSQSQILYG